MLHYLLTTDQKENQYFCLSELKDNGKGMNIKLKVVPESYELCGKPEIKYKTNFESLFVNYLGCFAMPSSESRTKEYSTNAYQFSIDNKNQVSSTSLSFSEVNDKWVGEQRWRSVGVDEIGHELHSGTKLDYIMFFNTQQLRHSEMRLLQNQCELERTRLLKF